ncbi:MAG: pentapeptide repeat-containing protein [Candidatus Lambdaproteobacteria bacterium]|nr:pentapeptide repeat-containing protein [Candidatus Lambdaproteobacteria bacterium]
MDMCKQELKNTSLLAGPCRRRIVEVPNNPQLKLCPLHVGVHDFSLVDHARFLRIFLDEIRNPSNQNEKDGFPVVDFRRVYIPRGMHFNLLENDISNLPACDFSFSDFYAHVDFSGIRFTGVVLFENSCVRKDVTISFHKSRFNRRVSFGRAVLYGLTNFKSSVFEGDAIFTGAKPRSKATDPMDENLFRNVTFEEAQFYQDADFHDAELLRADFADAVFRGPANFDRTTFHDFTKFDGARFLSNGTSDDFDTTFHSATFHGDVEFKNCEFKGTLSLEDVTFHKTVSFRKSSFGNAPSLINAKILEHIDFDGAKFKKGNELSYRRIKNESERQGNMWQATVFYGHELSEQRKNEALPRKSPLNYAFWILNDYGRKWYLPLVWLFIMWAALVPIYFYFGQFELIDINQLRGWQRALTEYGECGRSLFFSLQNTFFTWLFGRQVIFPDSIFTWLLGGAQSLLSAVLVAMTILSIRRRFRI